MDLSHFLRGEADRLRLPRAMLGSDQARLQSTLVLEPGLVPRGVRVVAPGIGVVEGTPDELAELTRTNPGLRLPWAPPYRTLLDQAAVWTHSMSFRNQTDLTGRGVLIGLVDTGLDVSHPDLRTPDGRTRVRWLLDMSRQPAGLQPEIEERYGCRSETSCAVYGADDIDALIDNDVALDEPRDPFGHGTHVASLAAGNGSSRPDTPYVGVAPEAELIVVRATRSGGGRLFDGDILRAVEFIFERAETEGLPVVVNLSLGGQFGPHDGSSPLERGLASFVGPGRPGRAIVVAVGNSGGLFRLLSDTRYPEPFGEHTEVHVPRAGIARVPILTPPVPSRRTAATVFAWLDFIEGDQIAVGVEGADGILIEPVSPGESRVVEREQLEVSVFNGALSEESPLVTPHSAAVILDGQWPSGATFALRLEGPGTARLWLQSEGQLGPSESVGALFPRASRQGSVNLPAAHPDLLAVGATVNRVEWVDHEGRAVEPDSLLGEADQGPDSVAFFSSAGPTTTGLLKPDLVAPGLNLIGAMSALADPRLEAGSASLFSADGACDGERECFVVDDFHAVTSGTSMASPQVAGAIALLMQAEPELTQPRARALLQAGARRQEGTTPSAQQAGVGVLDLEGTLDVLAAEDSVDSIEPVARESWLVVADEFLRPDPTQAVEARLLLRGERGRIAAGFDPARLRVELETATLAAPLERMAPGLFRFALTAPAKSGGSRAVVRVFFDDEPLLTKTLPVAVDRSVARAGVSAHGGCSVGPSGIGGERSPGLSWGLVSLWVLLVLLRRPRIGGAASRGTIQTPHNFARCSVQA